MNFKFEYIVPLNVFQNLICWYAISAQYLESVTFILWYIFPPVCHVSVKSVTAACKNLKYVSSSSVLDWARDVDIFIDFLLLARLFWYGDFHTLKGDRKKKFLFQFLLTLEYYISPIYVSYINNYFLGCNKTNRNL